MKKLLFLLSLVLFASIGVQAQQYLNFYNTVDTDAKTDTVTNTGTATIRADLSGPRVSGSYTTIVWKATKLSGTTAGTIALYGSNDGTNFAALADSTSVPKIQNYTATDVASQTGHWILPGCPYRYLEVRHTGAGTMSGTIEATAYVSKEE